MARATTTKSAASSAARAATGYAQSNSGSAPSTRYALRGSASIALACRPPDRGKAPATWPPTLFAASVRHPSVAPVSSASACASARSWTPRRAARRRCRAAPPFARPRGATPRSPAPRPSAGSRRVPAEAACPRPARRRRRSRRARAAGAMATRRTSARRGSANRPRPIAGARAASLSLQPAAGAARSADDLCAGSCRPRARDRAH